MFSFDNGTELVLEIDGETFTTKVDRPEFIDFWRNRAATLDSISDKGNPNMARDVVQFTVDMAVSLLGTESARKVFDGREVSLSECAAFIGYVTNEIQAQGVGDRLQAMTAKYGTGSVLR